MWKYAEPKNTNGDPITEKEARELFGVRDPRCPSMQLENGWWAVWCSTPRAKASDYDQLSSPPKDEAAAKVYPFVTAAL